MQTINDRICEIINVLGIKKTHFADKIHVSQAFTSQICSGIRLPSDRTISDICREFHVNERWLRYGEGDMFTAVTRKEEIAAFVGNVLSGTSEDFKVRFIAALAELNEDQWKLIEDMIEKLSGNKKE